VVAYDDPSGKCASAPSTTAAPRIVQINNTGPSSSNMTVEAVDVAGEAATQVAFNGYGRRPEAAATTDISIIDFTSSTTGSRKLRIEISSIGGVRMCDRDAPTNSTPPDPKACTT
jgi:type IV fimbrial biogenesis protein FimT